MKGNGFDELDVVFEVQKEHLSHMELSIEDQTALLAAIGKHKVAREQAVLKATNSNSTFILDGQCTPQKHDSSVNLETKRSSSELSATNDTRSQNSNMLSNNLIPKYQSITLQIDQTDIGEKVSCWSCYKVVGSKTSIQDEVKYFCSDTCFKKSQGAYKAACGKCRTVNLKKDCLLFDGQYYCSKKCKPAIEELASKLSRYLKSTNPIEEESPAAIVSNFDSSQQAQRTVPPAGLDESSDKSKSIPSLNLSKEIKPQSDRPSSILKDRKESARQRSSSKKRVSFQEATQSDPEAASQPKTPATEKDSGLQEQKPDLSKGASNLESMSKLQKYQRSRRENTAHFGSIEEYVREKDKELLIKQTSLKREPPAEVAPEKPKPLQPLQPLDALPPAPKIKQMANSFFKRSAERSRDKADKRSLDRRGSGAEEHQARRSDIKIRTIDPIQGKKLLQKQLMPEPPVLAITSQKLLSPLEPAFKRPPVNAAPVRSNHLLSPIPNPHLAPLPATPVHCLPHANQPVSPKPLSQPQATPKQQPPADFVPPKKQSNATGHPAAQKQVAAATYHSSDQDLTSWGRDECEDEMLFDSIAVIDRCPPDQTADS